jgi:hypothetical protein
MTVQEKKKSPRKALAIGFEVEFFIIDKEGNVARGSEGILKKVSEKTGGDMHSIQKESAEELIESGSYPSTEGTDTMKSLLTDVKLLAYAADEAGYALLPMGTYPGKFTPHILDNPKYNLYMSLFRKGSFASWGRGAGFHCHHALPWGVFDSTNLTLKELADSKNQESLVNAYNLLIALDPVLTTFMQSSPFHQGSYVAKDSRMVVLRGDEELGDHKSWLSGQPLLGALPPYVHTGTEIIHLVEKRKAAWVQAGAEAGISEKEMLAQFSSALKINWSPVRINPHGTFEQRGMDMNRLPILLSVSILIQTLLKGVLDGNIKVVPHDSAKAEPFSFDEITKSIFIAPFAHVKSRLQRLSAFEGLANDEIYAYCKRALGLAKQLGGDGLEEIFKPLSAMIAERQTTSDKILAHARDLGYKDTKKLLPKSIAAEIAKSHAKQMFEDIVLLEKMIEINEKLPV